MGKNKMNTTASSTESKMTIEDIKNCVACLDTIECENPPKYKIKWFTKIMNKLGWHRKYEIIVLDSSKLGMYPPFAPLKFIDEGMDDTRKVKVSSKSCINNL
jgi:hypothetical protein